jgi:4-hydroxy-tetrahydrodipicolinate synthase
MTALSARLSAALNGVHGIHVTPYAADGGVDEAGVTAMVRRIADAGVHAVVTGGNTGEFYALNPAEIVRCQHAAFAGRGAAAMVAGVGRSIGEAIDLAQSAEAIGYDAVMIHQPPDPFAGPRGVVAYVEALAAKVSLPLILYVRGPAMGPGEIAALSQVETVRAVKFARTVPNELAHYIESGGEGIAWICGLAEQWAPIFYAAGARGFTSGLVNVAPGHSLAIHAALEAGDFAAARALVADIAEFETLRTLDQNGANVTVVKAALALLGKSVGGVRPPAAAELPPEAADRLRATLGRWRERGIIAGDLI